MYRFLLLLFSLLAFAPLFPQEIIPGTMDTIRGIPRDMNTYVRRSPRFTYPNAQRSSGGGATINVTYTGFSASAQAAFQYAVDIWAAQLVSEVPIEIEATFSALSPGVLGSAGASYHIANFSNAPQANTYYPAALANSLAGCDLSISNSDITASFSSSASWYYGTDGATPSGQYDFVSVVLHELGHGLGFAGTASESGGSGTIGLSGGYPVIYDRYVENGAGTAITSYSSPSAALGAQLVSDDLFSNAASAVLANASSNVKLYLPTSFESGSSYSHWDDATFPAGNAHSLMTHAIGMAEAIHDPGDITRGLFEDMGWKLTNQAEAKMEVRTVWFSDLSALSFTDASIQATSWAWDFDDDGTVDATAQNPTHTYAAAGTYTARLTINGNPSVTTTQNITIGTSPSLPYAEDFESDDGNLFAYPIAGCDGGWEYGTSTSSNFNGAYGTIGGSFSWTTDLDALHGYNTRYALELPPLDLSTPSHDWIFEFDYRAACGTGAGFNIEYSLDGGSTWATLGTVGDANATNWYTSASITGLDGEPGFYQASLSTFRPTYMLNPLFGNSDVRLRFKFGAESSAIDGIQIDNIEIDGVTLDANPISITGTQRDQHIDLHWQLERPASSSWFEIEHSPPGSRIFYPIGQERVYEGDQVFEFTDFQPKSGINLYRIRHIYADGSYIFSPTAEVNYISTGTLSLYPNPASESVTIRSDMQNPGSINLQLFDLSGRVLMKKAWESQGQLEVKVSLKDLSPGVYLYKITDGSLVKTDRLMIK